MAFDAFRGECTPVLLRRQIDGGITYSTGEWLIQGLNTNSDGTTPEIGQSAGPTNGFSVTQDGLAYLDGSTIVCPVVVCIPATAPTGEYIIRFGGSANMPVVGAQTYNRVFNGVLGSDNLSVGDPVEEPPPDTTPPSVPSAPTTPATEEGVCEGAQVTLSWEAV